MMTVYRENATIVLVHGAWADGSSWNSVIAPLENAGLNVVAAPIPLTSLSDDIAAVQRVVERANGPVILAGHAYAGGPIGAVTDDKIVGYAYVVALAPDDGQTVAEIFYKDTPHPDAPKLEPDAHGLIWLPDNAFPTAFAQNGESERLLQLRATQRPISINAITENSPTPGWKTKPSWYMIAEQDRMIPPTTQAFMAERMGAAIERHDVDHTPMVTAPAVVVTFLLRAADQALGA
jgi:pimeloyl-ACP methyl ester carboxylesterase